MEFSNEGESFYHRFQGSFLQGPTGELMHCTGLQQQWLYDNWALFQSEPRILHDSNFKIYQNPDGLQHNTSAVIVSQNSPQPHNTDFEDFFVRLILDQADLCARNRPSQTPETESITRLVVDLFDSYLRYQGKDDRWLQGGRAYFAERIRHFTSRSIPIEFCLPAFPCKSSNGDKVTGPDPDRGEELALERLHGFIEAIERVYQPGAMMWIISDGHVFSDCIGVNDADVDAYGEKLKKMNHAIGLRRGNTDRVGFKSLVDLFQLASVGPDADFNDLARELNIPTIDHHVNTEITDEAELCRRILMAGCAPRKSAVRAKIDSKDAAITALYRGFSRFMLEDLEHHPHTRNMTRSQQKKLSARVAFEMILRNQAYSNLVEMLFPNHVRLSIHAHNNAGPKFGIQLFDPTRVRAVQGLSADGEIMTSLDLLHIPTPWHNSVVQLVDSDVILVAKAKLARAALAAGTMTGGLVREGEGRCAYFSLQKRSTVAVSAGPEQSPDSTEVRKEKVEAPVVAESARDVGGPNEKDAAGPDQGAGQLRLRRRPTLSERADAVVNVVIRRNTGNLSSAEPSWSVKTKRWDTWLGRLRWILSLFWPSSY